MAKNRRELRVLPSTDALEVQDALAAALSGNGPALLPIDLDTPAPAAPDTVAEDVALVVRTSGSTGAAKLVALSADAVTASSSTALERLGGPGQWLLALPAHYIAGLNVLARSLAAGTQPVTLPGGPFEPAGFAAGAAQLDHARRYTSLVPAQLARILNDPVATTALGTFDAVLVGGQATPPSLLEQAGAAGVRVVRTYGSSETSGGCVFDGVPLTSTRVRLIDGEVRIAGPTLALGYLDDEATGRAFVDEGGERWYRTGDGGELVDGVLRVTGRLDDQIVSGGVNVSLGAIETAVRRMPGLADAVVVSRPSVEWGTVPVVVCTATADLAEVRAFVAAELGRAAAPAEIVRVDAVPMLPSGKLDRLALARLVAH